MKTDVLTLVVLVFCLGVLASSLGVIDAFKVDAPSPSALQQGVANR